MPTNHVNDERADSHALLTVTYWPENFVTHIGPRTNCR